MKVEGGKAYCGADAREKVTREFDEDGRNGRDVSAGLEGEWRRIVSIDDGAVMFMRRLGPPETIGLKEFEDWAVMEVSFFLGRMAAV